MKWMQARNGIRAQERPESMQLLPSPKAQRGTYSCPEALHDGTSAHQRYGSLPDFHRAKKGLSSRYCWVAMHNWPGRSNLLPEDMFFDERKMEMHPDVEPNVKHASSLRTYGKWLNLARNGLRLAGKWPCFLIHKLPCTLYVLKQ